MSPKPTFSNIEAQEAEKSNQLIQKLLNKFFSLWPWLIVSAVMGVGLAYCYLRISFPAFKIHASVLVQDDNKSTDLGEASILRDFGLMGKSNVDNEAEIFKSRSLIEQVVRDMRLNVGYFTEGKVKNTEIWGGRPVDFRFLVPSTDTSDISATYILTFNKSNTTRFTLTGNEQEFEGHLGDTVHLPEGPALVTPAAGYAKWQYEQPLTIVVSPVDATTQKHLASLKVEIPNKQVSVIYLTLNDIIPAKGEGILNQLISAYMQANVTDKNRIADSTIQFIQERLRLVFGELNDIEKDIERFKTANKLTDLSAQSSILLENTSEYAKQQTGQEVQLSVVEELEQFLKENINNTRVVPSSLIMQDVTFNALVQRYNETQMQRERMLMSLTSNHPSIKTVDEQLTNLRAELLSSIQSVRRGIQISVNELKKRTNGIESAITTIPAKERTFLDYSRQQAIKQELYLFLLKKMEETAISKSATIASARIIDRAKSDPSPFKPSKSMILFMGLLSGLVLPFALSFGRDMLNTRVASMEDIINNTSIPVLSEIGHNNANQTVAVTINSRQLIAEQFRSLRTNLQYLIPNKNEKTILITSSMSGEGKSFLSINLAVTLAIANKKVILLELDLRKPKISENLGLQKNGFTNFIISEGMDWRNLVQKGSDNANFDVLASGPLPPNPTELLMLPKMTQLMEELKETYDYIIIDSPPAGMVTDAEIMATYANLTIYMVRHHYTFRHQIKLIEKLHHKQTLPRINIVVNDVAIQKGRYGYGYGYGYGNYHAEQK
ncbi:polysaccharide biosynthesis tyrosine autokinase [Paraflavitalea sp. CAU 1676]|uniref:GumC family protein n=1 Tax=Paraflavitalea sp. CAU 1676 TaxID=3032598 RepID=UPI0023DA261A|nr:polysaccharide biosynthesis tyrosine autokinase [Paraflavitalea sp. CAU 1676]MDF2189176.1 polysaccharide biosynthesis tyrosine autokinase [Paraflavitalea sp. CAU 1676]